MLYLFIGIISHGFTASDYIGLHLLDIYPNPEPSKHYIFAFVTQAVTQTKLTLRQSRNRGTNFIQ